jgi:hypothetical protein
MFGEVE